MPSLTPASVGSKYLEGWVEAGDWYQLWRYPRVEAVACVTARIVFLGCSSGHHSQCDGMPYRWHKDELSCTGIETRWCGEISRDLQQRLFSLHEEFGAVKVSKLFRQTGKEEIKVYQKIQQIQVSASCTTESWTVVFKWSPPALPHSISLKSNRGDISKHPDELFLWAIQCKRNCAFSCVFIWTV